MVKRADGSPSLIEACAVAPWLVFIASSLPLLAVLCSRLSDAKAGPVDRSEAETFLAGGLRPMTPFSAPAAANDAVLAPLYGEIERELRRAGHLR